MLLAIVLVGGVTPAVFDQTQGALASVVR